MRSFISFADHLSTSIGKAFSWCIVILMGGTVYEVIMAYVFNAPTSGEQPQFASTSSLNNQPYLNFDGTDRLLSLNNFSFKKGKKERELGEK